jgi:hypothetical protein
MGAEVKSPPGNGPYSYCIHGKIWHFVSLLYPDDKSRPDTGTFTFSILHKQQQNGVEKLSTKGI